MDISGGYSYDEKNEDVPGEVIVAKKKRNSQRCVTILKVPRTECGKLPRTSKCDDQLRHGKGARSCSGI